MADLHFEPYLVLAGLTCDSVLIAWGGFWFRVADRADGQWSILDDEALQSVSPGRQESIGACSEPFGRARVEVLDDGGDVVAYAETRETNHVWVRGLKPNTAYQYRVWVDDQPWATGKRMDWTPRGRLEKSERGYISSFRTHPAPDEDAPLTFVVLGDYGVGIRGDAEVSRRQRRLAHAIERACELHDVRLVITTGDNIYHIDEDDPVQGSGDEDDDWFFTYYQPYRYVINRLPVYPSVGNHDTGDTEMSDDRQQLADNFFLAERFPKGAECSLEPGLFYRFVFGKNVELVCVDTSSAKELPESFYFQHQEHAQFLSNCFARSPGAPRWRVPFSHHPPFCAGPKHGNSRALIERLVPMLKSGGVRAMFSGHEHNFQLSCHDAIHYFVSGAAGKLRPEWPKHFEAAHTVAWSPHGHFLLVSIDGEHMQVRPIRGVENGELVDLKLVDRDGRPVATPFTVAAG